MSDWSWRKLFSSKVTLTSFIVILGYAFTALLAQMNWIATDFANVQFDKSYQPPSSMFWLGTDFLGRSCLQRAVHGSKIAVFIGLTSAALSTLLGLLVGTIAGYFKGAVDSFIVWLYSTLESIPYILLISAFTFSLGSGLQNLLIALSLTGWVKICRLSRAEVFSLSEREYVTAARALGTSPLQIIWSHLIPNLLHLALIQFTLSFVFAVKVEVILSYLGLGAEPGSASWGLMINDAKSELARGVWWNLTAATLFMFVLILATNIFGDALRRNLDPKERSHLNS